MGLVLSAGTHPHELMPAWQLTHETVKGVDGLLLQACMCTELLFAVCVSCSPGPQLAPRDRCHQLPGGQSPPQMWQSEEVASLTLARHPFKTLYYFSCSVASGTASAAHFVATHPLTLGLALPLLVCYVAAKGLGYADDTTAAVEVRLRCSEGEYTASALTVLLVCHMQAWNCALQPKQLQPGHGQPCRAVSRSNAALLC